MVGRLGCASSGGEEGGGNSSRVHLGEGERRPAARESGVLTAEDSDTKLRIIRRFNLLVSQSFLYICVRQYTVVMVEIITPEYDYKPSSLIFLEKKKMMLCSSKMIQTIV